MNYELISPFSLKFEDRQFHIAQPEEILVRNERLEQIIPFTDCYGYRDGTQLPSLITVEITLMDGLKKGSLEVCLEDGTKMERGKDYEVNEKWGVIGRLEGGRIAEDTPVICNYSYYPRRLDSLVRCANGDIRLCRGKSGKIHANLPPILPDEQRILNILVDNTAANGLTEDNIYPVIEADYQMPQAKHMQAYLPKTMSALKEGRQLRILAWGDSITECTYMKSKFEMNASQRWQQQTLTRLRKRYPDCNIDLISEGWGGRSIPQYLEVPRGEPRNYEECVLALRPDLIITEFYNDFQRADTPEKWKAYRRDNLDKVRADFQRLGIEWIIVTPNYPATPKLGIPSQKGQCASEDPREYVKGLRAYADEHHIALADASLRYGHLWKEGIPYETLLCDSFIHPNETGHQFIADFIMNILGE